MQEDGSHLSPSTATELGNSGWGQDLGHSDSARHSMWHHAPPTSQMVSWNGLSPVHAYLNPPCCLQV